MLKLLKQRVWSCGLNPAVAYHAVVCRMSTDSEFHAAGPATENSRSIAKLFIMTKCTAMKLNRLAPQFISSPRSMVLRCNIPSIWHVPLHCVMSRCCLDSCAAPRNWDKREFVVCRRSVYTLHVVVLDLDPCDLIGVSALPADWSGFIHTYASQLRAASFSIASTCLTTLLRRDAHALCIQMYQQTLAIHTLEGNQHIMAFWAEVNSDS